jgi:hypothetical protein
VTIVGSIGGGLGDSCFGVGNWLLAVYYLNISTNMPRIIKKSRGQRSKINDYNPLRRRGVIANAVIPILEGVFMAWYNFKLNITHEPEPYSWVSVAFVVFSMATSILQVVSAFVQIWSVLGIRQYLNSTDARDERINVKTLLLHSATFFLFAISVIVVLGFNIILVIYPCRSKPALWYIESITIIQVVSFVSQCLLCVIFWQLSAK